VLYDTSSSRIEAGPACSEAGPCVFDLDGDAVLDAGPQQQLGNSDGISVGVASLPRRCRSLSLSDMVSCAELHMDTPINRAVLAGGHDQPR
jgi:hypothetical protein